MDSIFGGYKSDPMFAVNGRKRNKGVAAAAYTKNVYFTRKGI